MHASRFFVLVVLLPLCAGIQFTTQATKAATAQASPITIAFTARVSLVDDRANLLGGAIEKGDVITGSYTYDAETPDTNPPVDVGDYWYHTSPYGIMVEAGGFVFQTDPNNVNFLIEVVNREHRDNYLLRSYDNLPLSNGVPVSHISWQLDDSSGTAVSSDALPTSAPNLADWQSVFGLDLSGGDEDSWDDFLVRAHVTEVHVETSASRIFLPSVSVGHVCCQD